MNDSSEKNLKWLLLRATIPTKQILHKMGENHGISMMQLWTLSLIESGKGVPMNSISYNLGCDASNVTGIVDRLLGMGLIERDECAQDRRIKMISLTNKGADLRTKIMKEFEQTPVENLDQLTPEEQNNLCKLLEKATPKARKQDYLKES